MKHPFPLSLILLLSSGAGELAAQTWITKAPLPTSALANGARSLAVASLNGKFYTVGGLNLPNPISTVLEYDPISNNWAQKSNMLSPRYAPGAAALNGRLYAMGGSVDSSATLTASTEYYDPVSNTWSNRANMQQARYAFQAVALNGKIYAIGGQGAGDAPLPSIEEYDPLANTWTTKSNMPSGRVSFAAAAVNGKIYVLGGRIINTPIPEVYEYDPATNSWIVKAPIPTPRETLAAVVVNGNILTFGGTSLDGIPRKSVDEYSPVFDVWITQPSLPTARNECFAFLDESTVYVFGGYNDNTMQARLIAPGLNIYTAIELEFLTQTGKTYQAQASLDLANWTNLDTSFPGDGNIWRKLYSTRNQTRLFYRLQQTP